MNYLRHNIFFVLLPIFIGVGTALVSVMLGNSTFLLIGVMLVIYLLAKNINYSAIIIAAYLPFYFFIRLFSPFTFSFGPLDFPIGGIIKDVLLLMVLYLGIIRCTIKGEFYIEPSLRIPMSIFICYFFIEMLRNYKLASAFLGFRSYIEPMLFILIISNFVTSKKTLKYTLGITLFIGFIQALIGIYQYFGNSAFLLFPESEFVSSYTSFYLTGGVFHRVTSLIGHPNTLGIYLVMIILLGVGQYLYNRKVNKFFLMTLFLVSSVCLMITFSRSALVSLLFGIAFFLVFLPGIPIGRRNFAKITAFALILGMILYYTVPMLQWRTSSFFSCDIVSARTRVWRKAIEPIRDNPIIGIGLGKTGDIVASEESALRIFKVIDSSYLNIAIGTGLLGLSLFFGLLILIFRRGIKICKLLPEGFDKAMLSGALSSMVAILIDCIFVSYLEGLMGMFFWFLAGTIFFYTKRWDYDKGMLSVAEQERMENRRG